MQHGTIGRFVFATLLAALGTTPPAAAIDLGGDYVGFGADPFTVTDVQTGTTLQMMGHVVDNFTTYPLSTTGTVDPATGEFSVAGEITGFCPDFAYSGTGDGEKMTGTFTSRSCGISGTLMYGFGATVGGLHLGNILARQEVPHSMYGTTSPQGIRA